MRNTNGLLISYEKSVSYHYLAYSNNRFGGFMFHMPTIIFTIAHCVHNFYKYSLTLREDIHYRVSSF